MITVLWQRGVLQRDLLAQMSQMRAMARACTVLGMAWQMSAVHWW